MVPQDDETRWCYRQGLEREPQRFLVLRLRLPQPKRRSARMLPAASLAAPARAAQDPGVLDPQGLDRGRIARQRKSRAPAVRPGGVWPASDSILLPFVSLPVVRSLVPRRVCEARRHLWVLCGDGVPPATSGMWGSTPPWAARRRVCSLLPDEVSTRSLVDSSGKTRTESQGARDGNHDEDAGTGHSRSDRAAR